jgi:hypothetical protein
LETVITGVGSRGELPSPPFSSLSLSLLFSPCARPLFLPHARALPSPLAGGAAPPPCSCGTRGPAPPLPAAARPRPPARAARAAPPPPLPAAARPRPPLLARGAAPGAALGVARRGGSAPGLASLAPARGVRPRRGLGPLRAASRPSAWLAWPWRGLALPRLPLTRSRVRNPTRAVIILGF